MDIRFLKSLVAVVETGSISAGARREKLTPAAISQRIQKLERDLGRPLLARSAHSARPTEHCLFILPRVRTLIAEVEKLYGELHDGSQLGTLSVGAISTALTGIMPAILHELPRQEPQLTLKLVPGSSSHLYEELLAGRLDAAVIVSPPFPLPKTVVMRTLRNEPLMLLSRDRVDPQDVAPYLERTPYIRYDPISWGGRQAERYLEDKGLSPSIRYDMDALETITLLVGQGMGASLVPHWFGLKQDGFHFMEVPDGAAYARQVVLISGSPPIRPRALGLLQRLLDERVSLSPKA